MSLHAPQLTNFQISTLHADDQALAVTIYDKKAVLRSGYIQEWIQEYTLIPCFAMNHVSSAVSCKKYQSTKLFHELYFGPSTYDSFRVGLLEVASLGLQSQIP